MLPIIDLLLGGGGPQMVTWAPAGQDELIIFYKDFGGHIGHSKSLMDAASTEENVEAYIATLQALSGCSINAYNQIIKRSAGTTAPAAKDPATFGPTAMAEANCRFPGELLPAL